MSDFQHLSAIADITFSSLCLLCSLIPAFSHPSSLSFHIPFFTFSKKYTFKQPFFWIGGYSFPWFLPVSQSLPRQEELRVFAYESISSAFIVKVETRSVWGMCQDGPPFLSPSSVVRGPSLSFLLEPFIPRKREGQSSKWGQHWGRCVCMHRPLEKSLGVWKEGGGS